MLFLLRKIISWSFFLAFLTAIAGTVCYFWIEYANVARVFDEVENVPKCRTAIVLGTAKSIGPGKDNLYFKYRMEAAAKLFNSGKVNRFILSGDNRVDDYNEPKDMKKALIKLGIPDSCLIMDYAGLRTFDSMVRCKEVFGQDSVIVVSQQFHNARALFIANEIGLTAFAFNAQKVTTQKTVRIKTREFFSRIKCVFDLYVLNTKPKHLGDKIDIDS
jgi:SanA protein